MSGWARRKAPPSASLRPRRGHSFSPDGLLVAHGGFPLTDLHVDLAVNGDWNDPRSSPTSSGPRAPEGSAEDAEPDVSRTQYGYGLRGVLRCRGRHSGAPSRTWFAGTT